MEIRSMSLTNEQMAFFKDQGYLLVRGALDTQLCAEAQDSMWNALPTDSHLKREDPSTHIGPFPESERSTDPLHIRDGFLWQWRAQGTSEATIKLIYSDRVLDMARSLLGDDLRQAVVGGTPMGSRGPAWPGGPTDPALDNEGARGIYFTLPYGDKAREPDRAHTDGHPFQLGIVGLLSEVPEDGGAFKVWPGSHKRLYPTFQMQYDQPRIPYYGHLPSHKGIIHSDAYLTELEKVHADTQAVECCGQAGDVVFWHHRMAHMAGHNHTGIIRQAILADFWRDNLDAARCDPPQANMWRDWSDALNQIDPSSYSEAFAAEQRLLT
jgi:hypothetical protein